MVRIERRLHWLVRVLWCRGTPYLDDIGQLWGFLGWGGLVQRYRLGQSSGGCFTSRFFVLFWLEIQSYTRPGAQRDTMNRIDPAYNKQYTQPQFVATTTERIIK